jgi:hypothetical protein
LTLNPRTIQIAKIPENCEVETWTKFNERLNDLANQGYKVSFATETYILMLKKTAATRREE